MKTLVQQWFHPILLLGFCALVVVALAQQTADAHGTPQGAGSAIVR